MPRARDEPYAQALEVVYGLLSAFTSSSHPLHEPASTCRIASAP